MEKLLKLNGQLDLFPSMIILEKIIMRYDTDIQSEAKYYTDANGREVLE